MASRDSLQRPWLSLSHVLGGWYSGCHHPLICISQMQHAAINRSSNYGGLCFVTVIMMPFLGCCYIILLSEINGFYLLVFMCISKMFG